MNDLIKIADKANAIPLACARFSGDTDFYCLDLRDDISDYETPSGNLSMKESEKSEFTKLSEIIGND